MKLRVVGRISGNELNVYPHLTRESNMAVLKCHGRKFSIKINLDQLAKIILKYVKNIMIFFEYFYNKFYIYIEI